jgi:hypothetical protein
MGEGERDASPPVALPVTGGTFPCSLMYGLLSTTYSPPIALMLSIVLPECGADAAYSSCH